MADKFDQIMEKFLCPVSELEGRVKDSLYFLRKDGCFVFSHGYYHPTPGEFIGKIIYYPLENGTADIWGRSYEAMHKTWIDGEHVAIMNDVQIHKQYEVDPNLDRNRLRPLVADYTLEFPIDDFIGYFDPHRSLELCMEMYPQLVVNWTEQTSKLMEFPVEKLGVTGSLAYGKIEEEDMDYDVIFMGGLEENRRVRDELRRLARDPERKVFEFGRYWPIRIMNKGYLLCPFFVYENWDDVPLADAEIELVRDEVTVTGKIIDDSDNSYLPIILELGEVTIDGREREPIRIICYDGSIRGEYWEGQKIRVKGRLLNITDEDGSYEAVAADISYDIIELKNGRYPV